ncbi:MAG TPA: hypothetical protein P5279_11955 [Anaerohalosphaeraceae bacterium]|jgi:hypothetical protein|nr:hypothetical protein [Anaerohalosphaeraceae bacterium]HRT51203.1 hypothetical protein [Anaerohalosphaeraceae bacterium]HRT87465.1 hypothetical protein [Anaerohalosphaeraceae bacterium]
MSEIEVIRQIAQQCLTLPALNGLNDTWLWHRAQRILRNVEHICRLPELAADDVPIDRFCLAAATWFADSGFARYADVDGNGPRLALTDVSPSDLRDFSTQIVSEKLAGVLSAPRIDKINRIITESGNRETDMTEAKILSDARNLDDMGAVGIFSEFRRFVCNGKGVADVLESWKRKVDYRYWQARLKESFRFETVRKLAVQRFAATEYFMTQLKMENNAQDLEDLLLESLEAAGQGAACEV